MRFFRFLIPCFLCGCSYNEVEASIELDIPNEIIPVNFSAKLHLTDKIMEIKDDKTDYIIGSAILARWMQEHNSGKRTGNIGGSEESSVNSSESSTRDGQ